MDTKLYTYRSLEGAMWIRVVQLLPAAAQEDELRCRILHVNRRPLNLTDASLLHYSAVSYVWGEAVFSHVIRILDGEESYRLNITPTADCVLRRFRQPYITIELWLDAICLDQSNDIEKAEQIPLMGEIFREAEEVLVWLGPQDENVADAFTLLRMLAIAVPFDQVGQESFDPHSSQWTIELVSKLPEDHHSTMMTLFSRAWFTRRWTIQELALGQAAVIHANACKIPWPCLRQGLLAWMGIFGNSAIAQPARETMVMALNLPCGPRSLLDNLWDFHLTRCSIPRDAVRALLGFSVEISRPNVLWTKASRDEQLPSLTLDGVGKSIGRVFSDTAVYFLSNGYLGRILRHVLAFGPFDKSFRHHPSWIPDWSRQRATGQDEELLSALMGVPERQSDDHEKNWRLRPQLWHFASGPHVSPHFRAVSFVSRIDRIAYITPPVSSLSDWSSFLQHLSRVFGRPPARGEIAGFSFALCFHIFTLHPELLPPESRSSENSQGRRDDISFDLARHMIELAGIDAPRCRSKSIFRLQHHPLNLRLLEEARKTLSMYSLLVTQEFEEFENTWVATEFLRDGFGFCQTDAMIGDVLIHAGLYDQREWICYFAALHVKLLGNITQGTPSRGMAASRALESKGSRKSVRSEFDTPAEFGWDWEHGERRWWHSSIEDMPEYVAANIEHIMTELSSGQFGTFGDYYLRTTIVDGHLGRLEGPAFILKGGRSKPHDRCAIKTRGDIPGFVQGGCLSPQAWTSTGCQACGQHKSIMLV